MDAPEAVTDTADKRTCFFKGRSVMMIIINTNEKIKVMLSRKRYRVTLPDYNKEEISTVSYTHLTLPTIYSV